MLFLDLKNILYSFPSPIEFLLIRDKANGFCIVYILFKKIL